MSGQDTEINIKVIITKEMERSPLVRAMIRVLGLARTLLKKIDKGEEV